jgi:hypothetical protein
MSGYTQLVGPVRLGSIVWKFLLCVPFIKHVSTQQGGLCGRSMYLCLVTRYSDSVRGWTVRSSNFDRGKSSDRICGGRSFTGVKRPELDVGHLHAYTSPKCFHILDRDIFTFCVCVCVRVRARVCGCVCVGGVLPGLEVGVGSRSNRAEFLTSFCHVKKGTKSVL